jgi:hypothetical protein
MIENILNKMKREMKFSMIKQTSIFSVERNNINIKTTSQDCLDIRQLASKESCLITIRKEDSVTISR